MFQYPTGSTCASLIITDVTSFRIFVASSKEDRRKLIPMYNRVAFYRHLRVAIKQTAGLRHNSLSWITNEIFVCECVDAITTWMNFNDNFGPTSRSSLFIG